MNVYPLSRPQSELRQGAGRKLAGRQAASKQVQTPTSSKKREEKTEAQDFKQFPKGTQIERAGPDIKDSP